MLPSGETVARWRRDELLAALSERKALWKHLQTYSYQLPRLPHLPDLPRLQPPATQPQPSPVVPTGGRLPFAKSTPPSRLPSVLHWV